MVSLKHSLAPTAVLSIELDNITEQLPLSPSEIKNTPSQYYNFAYAHYGSHISTCEQMHVYHKDAHTVTEVRHSNTIKIVETHYYIIFSFALSMYLSKYYK